VLCKVVRTNPEGLKALANQQMVAESANFLIALDEYTRAAPNEKQDKAIAIVQKYLTSTNASDSKTECVNVDASLFEEARIALKQRVPAAAFPEAAQAVAQLLITNLREASLLSDLESFAAPGPFTQAVHAAAKDKRISPDDPIRIDGSTKKAFEHLVGMIDREFGKEIGERAVSGLPTPIRYRDLPEMLKSALSERLAFKKQVSDAVNLSIGRLTRLLGKVDDDKELTARKKAMTQAILELGPNAAKEEQLNVAEDAWTAVAQSAISSTVSSTQRSSSGSTRS
jgi:hypothetical protein